jgi:DNA-binding SARP family transcriptional activator/tetratricopeptide (TPR) repeat protein
VAQELWFAVLGPVRAWRGGRELPLGAPQQRAVLAALLIREGAQASLGELAQVLWGEAAPEAAVAVLRTYIGRLRRELQVPQDPKPDSPIRTVAGGYALEVPPDAFDLAVFRREVSAAEDARRGRDLPRAAGHLREALGLWRGEPLSGIPGAHAEAERSRLEILKSNTVATWLETELELGAHSTVIPELTRVVDRHPLDERFRRLLMLALYRAGQQAQALASYRQVQILLADELGVDPGPALQALYERILRADPELLARPPETIADPPADARIEIIELQRAEAPGPSPALGTVPEPPKPRTGLPPRLAVFSGRGRALEAANALLAEPSPGAVVINGMAGVGKTTFAVQWAHQLAARFPDGQFYLNLRGFNPGGVLVTAAEAVRAALEFLGVEPEAVPEDPDTATAQYRGLLARRRILLVLDNARLAAQVRPLLPGASGSLAIITSRNRLAGLQAIDGAQSITLDIPSPAEARDLLARRIGARRAAAEPEAVQQIVDRCGRLPLALAIAAAHCATHPAFPLSTVTAAMGTDGGTETARLDALSVGEADEAADARNVFSWSYHALTPEAARLFRLLALHPCHDATAHALASLAGVPPRANAEPLAELTSAHLLTEHAPGRYSCHDLLRVYAGELNRTLDAPQERAAALHRVLDHYLHSAIAAHRQYSPLMRSFEAPAPLPGTIIEVFANPDTARRWFETEHSVLMPMVHQALAEGCDEHAWHLAWVLDPYLYRSGRRQDSIVLHGWALQAAERLGQPLRQAVSHNFLGGAYTERKRLREALHHHTIALGIVEERGDVAEQAWTHLYLAVVAHWEGRSRDCIAHNERAADIYRRLDDHHKLAIALNNLGEQYASLGEHDKAADLCRQALDLWIELDEPHGQANSHDSLAYSAFHLGEHDQAFEHYRRAIDTFRDLGDGCNLAASLTRLGDARADLHDHDAARTAWSEALAILQALNHPDTGDLQAKLRQPDLVG